MVTTGDELDVRGERALLGSSLTSSRCARSKYMPSQMFDDVPAITILAIPMWPITM